MNRILPAEWERQSAVQLTWPVPLGHWGEHTLAAERVLARIADAIANRQGVIIACSDAGHVAGRLREFEVNQPAIRLCEVPANDAWARDHGGITILQDGQPRLLNFQFNGWGGKYPAELDNRITAALHAQGVFGAAPLEDIPFILEGGALETDGLGTLLTTTGCLLTPSRNTGFTKRDYERRLRDTLGIARILWLDHGYLEGDDTDGHIDTLARFTSEDTIAYTTCERPEEPHYDALKNMEAELRQLTTADGRPYRLVPLPLPAPIRDEEGQQLPATYANFLIINQAVLVPTYADEQDGLILATLQHCFPDREVVGIDCREIVFQYGSLHCLTMQYPAGVVPSS